LTTDVERRLAALTTSTPGNEFQRLIFSVSVSEANASGMVSSFPIPFLRLHYVHYLRLAERIVFCFGAWRVFPFSFSWPFGWAHSIGICCVAAMRICHDNFPSLPLPVSV
jgi:hypothetical protein